MRKRIYMMSFLALAFARRVHTDLNMQPAGRRIISRERVVEEEHNHGSLLLPDDELKL